MQQVNYNGQIVSGENAPPYVSGSVFRFPEGLFESMLFLNGHLQLERYHFERLLKGMELHGWDIPEFFDASFFREEVLRVVRLTHEPMYRIRFQVARQPEFVFTVEAMPLEEDVPAWNEQGWTLGLVDITFKDFGRAGNLKEINIPLYRDGAALAASKGWNDLLLVNHDFVVESGGANLFWVKDAQVFTPPLADGCIEGCMRKHLMASLKNLYSIDEKTLTTAMLLDADEVFLTNAVRRLKWVSKIQDRTYQNSLSFKIYSLLFT